MQAADPPTEHDVLGVPCLDEEGIDSAKKLEVGDIAKKFSSKQEWLGILNKDFLAIVVGGLEVSLRSKVAEKINRNVKLTPKENISLVHSINHHIFQFIGKQRPDSSLCRYCSLNVLAWKCKFY